MTGIACRVGLVSGDAQVERVPLCARANVVDDELFRLANVGAETPQVGVACCGVSKVQSINRLPFGPALDGALEGGGGCLVQLRLNGRRAYLDAEEERDGEQSPWRPHRTPPKPK